MGTKTEMHETRQELVATEYNTYSPDSFPGSRDWIANNMASAALADFDEAHPEIKAEVESQQAAKAKSRRDEMSDFVKAGS